MSPAALGAGLLAFQLADESLVNLDRLARAAHGGEFGRAHRFANTVRHEPSGLVLDLQGAVQLMGRKALLARRVQVHRVEPEVQRNLAALKEGADRHAERLLALAALVHARTGALALQESRLVDHAAMWADRAIRPIQGFQVLPGCVYVRVYLGEVHGRVPSVPRTYTALHGTSST